MIGTTVPPALDGLDFRGKSWSYTTLQRGAGSWATCKRCGSTLTPSRFVSSGARTLAGSRVTIDRYRCGCGKGHEIRRPLEAAAA
jgi:hypothetical protein